MTKFFLVLLKSKKKKIVNPVNQIGLLTKIYHKQKYGWYCTLTNGNSKRKKKSFSDLKIAETAPFAND